MNEEQNDNQSNSGFLGSLTSAGLFIWDFLKVIIVALIIILPIRYYIFQPFIVSGSSMEPNFSSGQYLIIDEISYQFHRPKRGEVVVMRFPKDPRQFFIKRVIGLPNEKVEIDNGRVIIFNPEHSQGLTLDESYLLNQGITFPHNTTVVGGKKTIQLSSAEYFMLGDNRLASSDSRDWGPLPAKDIIGKVFVRLLPLTAFAKFQSPQYSF